MYLLLFDISNISFLQEEFFYCLFSPEAFNAHIQLHRVYLPHFARNLLVHICDYRHENQIISFRDDVPLRLRLASLSVRDKICFKNSKTSRKTCIALEGYSKKNKKIIGKKVKKKKKKNNKRKKKEATQ